MSRLKRIANIDELNDMDMPEGILNQAILNQGDDSTVDQISFRRLMNPNEKFVVEVWILSNKKYGIFSGNYGGQWTTGNIKYDGPFDSESEAQTFVQNNLQNNALEKDIIQINKLKRLNDFKKLQAKGKEPDYSQMADGFLREIKIDDKDKKSKKALNKYYDHWVDYVRKYYPEWGRHNGFIWKGWNYFVDNTAKDNDHDSVNNQDNDHDADDTNNVQQTNQQSEKNDNVQEVQEQPQTVDTTQQTNDADDTTMDSDDASDGSGDSAQ